MAGSLPLKLKREAKRLARVLEATDSQLVLAESCTGGLAASSLTQIPGISRHFCGSQVVYQSETKTQWLNLSKKRIRQHGAESLETTEALARQILNKTRQATVSGAITGDLGPMPSNPKKVGVIFVACAIQTQGATKIKFSTQMRLPKPRGVPATELRILLQQVASLTLLRMVRQMLSDTLRQHRGN